MSAEVLAEDTGARATYSYDPADQLIAEHRTGSGAYGITYTYDPVGNRLTKDAGTELTTSTYDDANRHTRSEDSSGITTFTYDADGNQLTAETPTGEVTTNTWDYENQTIQTELPDSTIVSFTWNADQLKIERDDGFEVQRYPHDRNNVLLESDDADVTQQVNTYDPQPYGNLVSRRDEAAADRILTITLTSTTLPVPCARAQNGTMR